MISCSIIVDDYRINLARRDVREAEAALLIAEVSLMPAIILSLVLLAIQKSQTAVYYSHVDPEDPVSLVSQSIENEKKVKDTGMRILIQMERLIQRNNRFVEKLDKQALVEVSSALKNRVKDSYLVIDGAEPQSA